MKSSFLGYGRVRMGLLTNQEGFPELVIAELGINYHTE